MVKEIKPHVVIIAVPTIRANKNNKIFTKIKYSFYVKSH